MAVSAFPRTRLEQRLRELRLSHSDARARYTEEALRIGEGEVALSPRQLKRWLAGGAVRPRPLACRILESWLGERVERLLGPPEPITAVDGVGGELVVDAGRRAVEHALNAANALDPTALEHLHAAAAQAAHDCLVTPPLEMLTELVALRDTIYEQLDRTQKPRQQAELYLLAGQVCGLLSYVSLDFGNVTVAADLARAAHTYGSIIDHPSLCAWARAIQVTAAFWNGQPRRAAAVAESSLATAPPGTARVRLHAVRARSLGLIGARDEVTAELALAAEQLEHAGHDEFLDGIGGELAFDRPRVALCASTAYVALGDGERAEPAAEAALRLLDAAPGQRWNTGAVSAAVDLGTARTLRGDLAGTEAALADVFALPVGERTESVARRLQGLGRVLGLPRYRGAVEAAQLGEDIEAFTATSLASITARAAIGPS